MNRNSYPLVGLTSSGTLSFCDERAGDPLEAFPSLRVRGQPFNDWMAREILEPAIGRWSERTGDPAGMAESVVVEFEGATLRARIAFRKMAEATPSVSSQGVLAALGVTANLHRTLGVLGEFLLGDGPAGAAEFTLSRRWCGFVAYPKNARDFSMRVEALVDPGSLRGNRCDYGHLRNALRCSTREVEPRCREGLDVLRARVKASGLFRAADLRHLLSASIPADGG